MVIGDVRAMNRRRILLGVLLVMVLIYASFFSVYQIARHKTFQTYVDLLAMEQTIWNTVHGRFMRSTVYPPTGETVTDFSDRLTESRLATHVQPLLLLLAIPYALVPRPETLLVLMCVSVAVGAIPMFFIAERRLKSPEWALVFALGYLILPAVETANAWDIHGISFVPSLLLAALDAAERGNRRWWWLWALLAMTCREDMPFLVGWAMVWMAPRERRREAFAMLGGGTVWSVLNFFVIIPQFAAEGSPYLAQFFPPGTEMTLSGMTEVVGQGWFWFAMVRHFLTYNVLLGLPVLFLYWLHLPSLLAISPILVINVLNWKPSMHVPSYSHYSVPIVAWVLVGAIEGFLILERRLKARRPTLNWRGLLGEAVGVSVIAAHLVTGYTPLSRAFAWPVTTGQEPAIHAALAQVPAAAPASLEMHMGAHGARRDMLRIFPDTRDVTWIALNVWLGENPYGPTTLDALKVLVDAPNWSVVEAREGIVVLQHGSGPPRDLVKAFDPTSRLLLAPVDVAFTSGAPALNLQGLSVTQLPVGHFNVCSDWNVTDAEDLLPSLTLGPTQIPGASSATLDVVPWLASQPEPLTNVRVCTHLVTKLARFEVTLKVQVHDAAGAAVPVHIVDEGAWNGSLDAVADGVVFRIPIGW